ncbi:MAG: hypothetical protein NT062_08765 [Proteobacteria bacterium]|nr:hypothetical protein [Pseudomonadota bacterium]
MTSGRTFVRAVVVVVVGCKAPPTPPSPPPSVLGVPDAGPDATLVLVEPAHLGIDAPVVGPDPQCRFYGALERIEITTDLATRTGTLVRSSPGRNHRRELRYTLVAESPTTLALVFAGYGPHDYPPILNWHGPTSPRERMTVGKSIVARIVVRGDLSRIVEGEVDLHTEMTYQTRDHSYPCATIDGAFDVAHPDEFLPR